MIKVLLDTNILVSAILNNRSVPYQALKKALEPPCQGLICEQSIEELRRVFDRKFPEKISAFEHFIATAFPSVEIIPVPSFPYSEEKKIRDIDDRPILRSAVSAGADILLTGDKDFLESTVKCPKIMTAAQFVKES